MVRILNIPAATLATALWAGAAGAVTLAPTSAGPFDVGDTITIEMSTPDGFPEFFGFEGDLTFDTDVLSLQGVTVGEAFDFSFVGPEQTPPTSFVSGGLLENPELPDSELLASFAFEALTVADDTSVDFDLLVISPGAESLFDGIVSTLVTVGTGDDTTPPEPGPNPAPIPLPAGILMLLTGIAGLPVLRLVRRHS